MGEEELFKLINWLIIIITTTTKTIPQHGSPSLVDSIQCSTRQSTFEWPTAAAIATASHHGDYLDGDGRREMRCSCRRRRRILLGALVHSLCSHDARQSVMILMFRLEWTRSNKQHARRWTTTTRPQRETDLNYSACNCCNCDQAEGDPTPATIRKVVTCGFLCTSQGRRRRSSSRNQCPTIYTAKEEEEDNQFVKPWSLSIDPKCCSKAEPRPAIVYTWYLDWVRVQYLSIL